jgi:hypothetical protein
MKTETYMTIIEQVRSQKEAVAARHDFDVARIIAAARERQESSSRRIIRLCKEGDGYQLAKRPGSNSESNEKLKP